jgi:serine/threonine protein kinase
MRLHRFESSWDPTNSISTEEEILKLKESDILFDRMLGYGSFSTVRRVYLRNQATESFESRPFAVKQLKPEILYDQQRLKSASADLALETKILAYLKHDNIIALRGVAEGDMIEFLKAGKFFIVLDLLLETLDTRLDRWRRQFKRSLFQIRSEITLTKRLRDVALGIANGMEYLHSKNIMFRLVVDVSNPVCGQKPPIGLLTIGHLWRQLL